MWAGSRFGLKGAEDLGGGTKAIFQLESGLNSATGAAQFTNAMFGRQAWIGVTNNSLRYVPGRPPVHAYYTLLSPYSPTTWLTGFYGAHPGDLDALDTIYRANNSLVYTSPKLYGFTFSGSYSLGGVPGSFNSGSTWSGAAQYINGPVGIAVGIMRINNSTPGGGAWGAESTTANNGTQVGVSAVTNGYQTAQAQQRFAVTGGYNFGNGWDISGAYSNVQYIPGVGSSFHDTAIFNTGGLVLHWKPAVAWDFAAGYSYTRATRGERHHEFRAVPAGQPVRVLFTVQAYRSLCVAGIPAHQRQYARHGRRRTRHYRHGNDRRRLPERAVLVAQPVCRGRRHRASLLNGVRSYKKERARIDGPFRNQETRYEPQQRCERSNFHQRTSFFAVPVAHLFHVLRDRPAGRF